jgi:ferric-dicitrate binding protein FerR (iron transport regulator)
MNKAENRLVYLSGEAFFDVTKNKEHPFIIKTDKISIKVLGTEFNVKAYPNEKKTETTLLRGAIELTVNNKPYQKIMLKPNEKIVLVDSTHETDNKTTDHKTHAAVDAGKIQLVIEDVQPVFVHNKEYVVETSWRENNLVFDNETLEDLAPRLEKWFDVTIDINSKSLRSRHFTGVFNKQTLEEALISLQLANPFTFKINQRHVYLN